MWKDIRDFIFSILCLVGGGKVKGWEKMSFYKFTHMRLLKKNDAQLKQKVAVTQIY